MFPVRSKKGCLMLNLAELKREWERLSLYERFEQVIIRLMMIFVSLMVIDAVVLLIIELFNDFRLGLSVTENVILQDIFGSILTILILLEFNHSIALALANKSNVIQAKAVVLIAILVVARKIILLDFPSAKIEYLAGIGGTALALGVLYWLLKSERHSTSV
jgi:uncharacterized membrane protein (DUF373 family)